MDEKDKNNVICTINLLAVCLGAFIMIQFVMYTLFWVQEFFDGTFILGYT